MQTRFLLFFFFINDCFCQKADTIWFNNYGQETTKEEATYYRPAPKAVGESYFVKDYFLNNSLKFEAYTTNLKQFEFDGIAIHYFPNRDTELVETYKKGVRVGEYRQYFSPSKLSAFCFFPSTDSEITKNFTYYFNGNIKTYRGILNNKNYGISFDNFQNGQRAEECIYDNEGRLLSIKKYYLSGILREIYQFIPTIDFMEIKRFDETGKITLKGTFRGDTVLSFFHADSF